MNKLKRMNGRERTFLLITIPILALFFCFNTLPLIKGVIYSFTNFRGYGEFDWVGIRNYTDLFTDARVGKSYLFTFKLAIVATIVVNVLSLVYIVSGMFVPFAILMMPLVKQTAQMGIDNIFGVILCYLVFYMPMNVLLYSGYLKNIPLALEEAAHVDGATTWKTYWSVIFPIMKPMHATVAVLTALGTWNDVMTPLVILAGSDVNTLPLAQMTFQTQFGTNYNLAFASYLLALLPILIFYLICQKQILNGVVNGAVK